MPTKATVANLYAITGHGVGAKATTATFYVITSSSLIRAPRVRIYEAATNNETGLGYRDFLQGLGWIVDLRDDANLSTDTDLADFDLIIGTRLDDTLTLGDDIRSKAEAATRPYALFGFPWTWSPEGTGYTPGPEEAKLTGTWETADNSPGQTKINIVDNTHYITSPFSTGLLTILTTGDSSAAVDDGQSTVGDVLGEADSAHANFVAGQANLIAIEAGTDDLTTPTAVATTERALVWGMPHEPDYLTDDGKELFERAFTWLLSAKPLAPTATVISVTNDTADMLSSSFASFDAGRTHSASRWQVTLQTDTSWSSIVYDSGYLSDLVAHTAIGLSAEEDYMMRVLHRDDLGQDSGWSAEVDFTTADYGSGTSGAAGFEIEFYTSGDASISSVELLTEDTDYISLIEEGIVIPDNTAYFITRPIKRGATSGGAAVKEINVDRGKISRGFGPYPFRPEVHTDELILGAHNTTGASSGNALTIDWSEGRHQTHTLTESVTYTFTNMEVGVYFLRVIVDGSSSITWPGSVQWASGSAPTLSGTNGQEDLFMFVSHDGTDVIGTAVAQNVS